MSLKKNIVANFAGSIWMAIMNIAFVPLYVALLGAESYALVGVFSSLQLMFSILDFGLAQTMTREMARHSGAPASSQLVNNTAKTFEVIYWGVGLVIAAIVILSAEFISTSWLNPEKLTRADLLRALSVMGIAIGLRWPCALYLGGLIGLQRQVRANFVLSVVGTLQSLGAVGVLYFIKPTIEYFFYWQVVVALIQVLSLRATFWLVVPKVAQATFDKNVLKNVWKFAAGVSAATILATVLTQVDKIVLSKILTLEMFGYYTFATTVATVLYKLILPIFTAFYPRLSELVSANNESELVQVYHTGCQYMAVAILPFAFTLAFFSKEVIGIWTHNPELTQKTYLLVSVLVIGNTLNGFMNVPYALQLAYGWSQLALYTNLVSIFLFAPSLYYAVKLWGALGACFVWVGLNVGYILFNIQFMHLRILKEEKWHWYLEDVLKPMSVAFVVVLLFRVMLPDISHPLFLVVSITCVGLVAVLATSLSTSSTREIVSRYLVRRPFRKRSI